MNKLIKVPSVTTGNDAEVAAQFNTLLREAQSASKRIVAFGLYAWHVKLCLLKHGQFMPWVAAHCPDITHRAVQGHMSLAKSVMEACGIKSLKNALANTKHASNLLPWELPVLPESKIPDAQKPLARKISDLIDGKSARMLFTEFKQADDRDGEKEKPTPKRGRLKGQGGASKDQRLTAAEVKEKARVLNIQLEAKEFANWILENCCGPEGVVKTEPEAFAEFFEAYQTGWDFLSKYHAAQKKGAK